MRWLDRHGRPLPVEPIFAALLLRSQRRAASTLGRIMQARQRQQANAGAVLLVRDAQGTRVREGMDV